MFGNIEMLGIENFDFGEHMGPENPNEPSNTFSQILNMGSISTRKHRMETLGNLEYGIKIFKKT